jgi:hypothetical protein
MATIHDSERLIRKGVRTRDGYDLGNVIAVNDASITVQGKRIYKFPNNCIDFFNGSEVFLNLLPVNYTIIKLIRSRSISFFLEVQVSTLDNTKVNKT